MTSFFLLVLRSRDPKALAANYQKLGLSFAQERHARGPAHYACAIGPLLLEIYPANDAYPATSGAMFGLAVPDLECALKEARGSFTVLREPGHGPCGYGALLRDAEGHRVELTQASS